MTKTRSLPELLVPAGNLNKLKVALAYGADAIYVGAVGFSMRPDEASFDPAGLAEATDLVHAAGKKIYVAVNTLMFPADVDHFVDWLDATRDLEMDAIILSDLGGWNALQIHRPELPVHISTQMSIANPKAAEFLYNLGAKRIVLARECSLADARRIAQECSVELEIFAHGAMCVAVSGRCLLSAHLCGQSASKGECKHSCRWEWQLVEQKRPGLGLPVFEVGQQTIFLGSRDLCLIEHIPDLVETGVRALKIEGRMKSDYYVAAVTRVYRAALDAYADDPDGFNVDPQWLAELQAVSHRPYSTGFAFGYPGAKPQALQTHNRPESSCQVVGYVDSQTTDGYLIEVKNPFRAGETLEWIGPQMQGGWATIKSITNADREQIPRATSASKVEIQLKNTDHDLPPQTVLRRRSEP